MSARTPSAALRVASRAQGAALLRTASLAFPGPAVAALRALPRIEVEPDTFTVRVDGEVVEAAPATELPMAQRYFLF